MAVALEKMADAIYDWFKADQAVGTIYVALAGRLYYRGAVPTPVAWPYCTFQTISETQDWDEDNDYEHLRIQFSLFEKDDPDCAKVDALASKLRNRFDWKTLTFAGSQYATLWFRPEFGSGGMSANPGEHDRRTMRTQDYLWWLRAA